MQSSAEKKYKDLVASLNDIRKKVHAIAKILDVYEEGIINTETSKEHCCISSSPQNWV